MKVIKVCLHNAVIISIVIYAGKSWSLKEEDNRKLNVFEKDCFGSIVGVFLFESYKN